MPVNTPNLNIPKLTDSDNFNTDTLGAMFDAIDQNAAKKSDLTNHNAENIGHVRFGTTAGSANTYTVTLNPIPTSYVDGLAVAVKIHANSTGASTLNVNGLGAKALKKANGTDLTNLKANGIYTFRYNSSTGNFILQGEGASGNATASDLLSGKTATTDAGEITGTMPNRGVGGTVMPTTVDQTKAAGYYSSDIVVKGDADLLPENIRKDKDVFGVVGTLVAGAKPVFLYNNDHSLADGQSSTNITISSTGVNMSKTVVQVIPLVERDGGTYPKLGAVWVTAHLVDSKTVQIKRSVTTGYTRFRVIVTEYDGQINVQRGIFTWKGYIGTATYTNEVLINPINIINSSIVFSHRIGISSDNPPAAWVLDSKFSYSTNPGTYDLLVFEFGFQKNDDPNLEIAWQVVTIG